MQAKDKHEICVSLKPWVLDVYSLNCFTTQFLLSYSFLPRIESNVRKTDAPSYCERHCCKDGPVRNGLIGQRPQPINPERLKDFGEEDYLNGGVNLWEMRIISHNEELLRDSAICPDMLSQPVINKFIRFEDISAAAFKIQCGVQKTPCMVRYMFLQNSKPS